jgi:hypothetical protein
MTAIWQTAAPSPTVDAARRLEIGSVGVAEKGRVRLRNGSVGFAANLALLWVLQLQCGGLAEGPAAW